VIFAGVFTTLFSSWLLVRLTVKLWLRLTGATPNAEETQIASDARVITRASMRMLRPAWFFCAFLLVVAVVAAFAGR
jgi:hypothetical protein